VGRFPERNLNQTAVYWASPTSDGRGGFTYTTPVEINCRWIDKTEIISGLRGAQPGQEVISKSQVQVKQDLDEGGILYLGNLTDLTVGQKADPMTIDTAYKIKRFEKIITIKSRRYFRKVYL